MAFLLICEELYLIGEITNANKMNEQENMTKNLKVQLENNKFDKNLKQNLYAFEGYADKGVFGKST